MPRVRKERELAVEKDNGISRLEKVFCGSSAAGSSGEVVDKSYCLVFEGDGGTPRGDQDNIAAFRVVVVYEGLDFGGESADIGGW